MHCCGRHFQVLCQIFSLPQISKTIQLSTGNIRPNAELNFQPIIDLNALNSNIECGNAFAVSFAEPQREDYKFYSLLGSVGELSGDKL